jgi:hypothetical protein
MLMEPELALNVTQHLPYAKPEPEPSIVPPDMPFLIMSVLLAPV